MDLVPLIIVLIVAGLVIWLIQNYIPLPAPFKTIVIVLIVLVVIIWLLRGIGVMNIGRV